MKVCIYSDGEYSYLEKFKCENENGTRPARAEWEHAFTYAGRQIDEWWAIIGVCWYHHRGGGLRKNYNRYRALERVSDAELQEIQKKYPAVDWKSTRSYLRCVFSPKI